MIISFKHYLSIPLLLLLLSRSCTSLHLQFPFLPPQTQHKQINTLKLKTIYHHGSAHGPIPNLFRKIDVQDQNQIHINQAQQESYTLQSKIAVMNRPATSDVQELLQLRDPTAGTFARWETLNSKLMRPMHMESTIGLIPDVNDRTSVLSLAMMTNNAYLDIDLNNTEWYDIGGSWKLVSIDHLYQQIIC
jgi:putative lipase involved disintegration of autophagic bodies